MGGLKGASDMFVCAYVYVICVCICVCVYVRAFCECVVCVCERVLCEHVSVGVGLDVYLCLYVGVFPRFSLIFFPFL